ncbi:FecR family protein [Dyadobacter fermentans]|uniref:FecR family protein n=1 Tax=Dyadobacter fermentans TaxID=94254 RepID=UPI001CBD1BF7|nr:FecR domain-containing protein [Dyadobacter fermentans]MBZ1359584.1 FecR domain-containing protein [Dyadobacter fermentans]
MKRKKNKQEPTPDPEHLTEQEKVAGERARLLFKTLRNETFSPDEKDALWNQVGETISQRKQRSFNIFWIAAAASVTLLLLTGVGYLVFYKDTARTMQEFAARGANGPDETQLILGDKRVISLRNENSSVEYKDGGALIQVDSSSTIDQQVAGDQQFNTLVVPYGKRSVLTLADGTRIWLNSGSKLVYPSHFDKGLREVYLEGQAYFSVAHAEDAPFYVHTKDMEVKVLGTEFDVSAYDDDPYTATVLTKGSVELTTQRQTLFGSKKTQITPGTRAVFDQDQAVLQTQQVDVQQYISWKDGYLALNVAPLSEIIKKLSRYYRVDIELKQPKLAGVKFGGDLILQDDVRDVLKVLALTTGLNYKQQPNERRYVLEESTIKP